jgi:hypothetical protein
MIPTILGIAFAAACVWLAVRLVNRREKPGVGLWAAVVVIAVLVGYPLSIGPACWVKDRYSPESKFMLGDAYRPIIWTADRCPEFVKAGLRWYLSVGLREREYATFSDHSITLWTRIP